MTTAPLNKRATAYRYRSAGHWEPFVTFLPGTTRPEIADCLYSHRRRLWEMYDLGHYWEIATGPEIREEIA